jgi:hypothetical protein
MEPKEHEGHEGPMEGIEVKEGETAELVEDGGSKPIAASWDGVQVVFRARRGIHDSGAPTRKALEDAIRTGLEAVYGDDFEISVSQAERTDR